MTTRTISALLVCGAALFAWEPAQAGFMFNGPDGAPAADANIQFKLSNLETIFDPGGGIDSNGVPDVGDRLFAIFNVTSITDKDSSKIYWNASADQELTGVFDDFIVDSVFPFVTSTGTGQETLYTGGNVRFYFDDTPDFNGANGPGAGGTFSGHDNGTLFLDSNGVGGEVGSNSSITLRTLMSTDNVTNVTTGSGSGFLDVVFTSNIVFQSDGRDPAGPGGTVGEQDLKVKFNFDNQGTTAGWHYDSEDPIEGAVASVVPEPATFALWGLLIAGGTGLTLTRRRRAKDARK